ncbi:MAG: hypothetical protein BM564_05355 [Bacteroidetes bacterium MedPE-SWsnd-G2]|nr:MAG: hypothetical protein BM564_05355 [Bacteroidetes bacterium MedPE-SWsnd-G2]
MKILHLSGARSWGGNEQQLVDLIFELKNINIDSALFCFEGSELNTYAKAQNLTVCAVPKSKVFGSKFLKAFKSYIDKLQPDVIHLHTSNAVTAFVVADLKYKLNIPAVFSKKGLSNSASLLSALKYNYSGIKKILCVSKYVEEGFKAIIKPKNHHRLCVVHDGLNVSRSQQINKTDLRAEYNLAQNDIIVGCIANHNRAKDLITFVNVANQLVHDKGIKQLKFVIIGSEGKYTSVFKPLISEFKLENHVILTGFVEHAMSLVPQMDIYLVTSEREGGPSSALEAAFQKRPIISTAVGIMPELIENGQNGYLCEVKDVDCLSAKLEQLVNDSQLRSDFGEAVYDKLMRNFTGENLASETLKVYKEVIHD